MSDPAPPPPPGASPPPGVGTAPEPTVPPPGADGEQALDRRIVLAWRIALLPELLPAGLVVWLVPRLLPVGRPLVAALVAVVVVLTLGPLQTLRWRRWSWRLTDAAIELRSGVLVRRHVVVPHFRVQQIDVLEGPLERLVGLATLRVTTASASGSVELAGLSASLAPTLRGELLARAARANAELGRDGLDAV